jgi:acyl carrier protein
MTAPKLLQSDPSETLSSKTAAVVPGPLNRLEVQDIRHILRGFPQSSIEGAIGLRTGSRVADFEACLFGILFFYRPAGTEGPEGEPSGDTRLHEDLGLDSLSMAEAMFKIEELFDIGIENGELAEVETVADARRLLQVKLQGPTTDGL